MCHLKNCVDGDHNLYTVYPKPENRRFQLGGRILEWRQTKGEGGRKAKEGRPAEKKTPS